MNIILNPIWFFFWITGFAGKNGCSASEYVKKGSATSEEVDSSFSDIDARDLSVIKNPQFESLSQMTFDDFIETFDLFHDPAGPIKSEINQSTIINLIAKNFFYGTLYTLNKSCIQERSSKGIRCPHYNKHILYQIQNDLRIVQHLQFCGCVELFKLLVDWIQAKMAASVKTNENTRRLRGAVDGLQEFLDFFLKEPSVFEGSCDGIETQKEIDYRYFQKISVCSLDRLERIGAFRVIPSIFDRFKPVLDDGYFLVFFRNFQNISLNLSYTSMRSKMNYFAKNAGFSTCTDAELMSVRFRVICDDLLPKKFDIKSSKMLERALSIIYAQMVPVLRALMLIDDEDQSAEILEVFKAACLNRKLSRVMTDLVLQVLDKMFHESDFIANARSVPCLSYTVFSKILNIFGWSQSSFLKSVIGLNLLFSTEVSLMFYGPLDKKTESSIILLAVADLERTTNVELIFLVVGYCPYLNAQDILTLSHKISLPPKPEPWSSEEAILEYNSSCLGVEILRQAAVLLHFIKRLQRRRSILMPFPCPVEILDFLHPKLFEYDPKRKAKEVHRLYPHHSLYNLAQLVLLRMFGIGFAQSRIKSDDFDIPEWREVIGFMNFMIQRNASLKGFSGPVEEFYDPIIRGLRPLSSDSEEYASMYRETAAEFFECF
jgi:hypothetical protein